MPQTQKRNNTPKRILIVEDEIAMAQALELKLKKCNYDTTVAKNGTEALRQLARTPFDLVILDIIMPYTDGFTVLETMRARHYASPVIVVTNLSQEEDAERAKKLGAKAYYIKSDTPLVDIITRIKQYFSS